MSALITDDGSAYLLNLLSNQEQPVEVYYVALITGESPSFTSTGDDIDEPIVAEYTRAPLENLPGNWTLSAGNVLSNATDISFSVTTVDWGTVRAWAICDAPLSGRAFFVGDLLDPLTAAIGDQFVIPAGSLAVALATSSWQVYL